MKKGQSEKYSKMFEEVIDKAWSKKIIDKLYEKGLDATKFERFLYELREYFMKNKYWKLVKEVDDKSIDEIIGDIEMRGTNQGTVREYSEQTKTVWMFNEIQEFKEVKEGDKVEIQIMRSGKWKHPMYGEVNVDKTTIDDVIKNFEENTRGIDLAIDENHEPNHKALGWIRDLKKKGEDALFATIELTKIGADLISQGAYKYFSPEIIFNKKDEETGQTIKNLLIGGAFTNRPFFKAMKPLMANEEVANGEMNSNRDILFFNTNGSMKTILDLLAKFAEGKFTKEDRELLTTKFSELPEGDRNEDLVNAVNEAIAEVKTEEPVVVPEKKEEFKEAVITEVKAVEGEVTIQMSELDALKKDAAEVKIFREKEKKNQMNAKVSSLVFSESNKVGVVLPKMSNEVAEFAFSLSDTQAEKFFEIVGKLQNLTTEELGHDKGSTQAYSEEHVKFLQEKLGMSQEDAIAAATDVAKK